MDKKQRILLTMLELSAKNGLNATPISKVAKEANVAVGTIYHYYETKEDIVKELYTMIVQDLARMLVLNRDESKPFKEQYKQLWINFYNYFIANPSAFYFMDIVAIPPIIDSEEVDKNIVHYKGMKDFMLQGIKDGYLKNVELKLLMQMAFGNLITISRIRLRQELIMDDKQIEDAMEMSWDCIRLIEK
jgi:TetR/AcrR family transcriptional repressor of multidrug resistance operon